MGDSADGFGYILAQLAHLAYPTWVTPEISLSFLWRMGWPLMKELGANAGEVLPIEPKPGRHRLMPVTWREFI